MTCRSYETFKTNTEWKMTLNNNKYNNKKMASKEVI